MKLKLPIREILATATWQPLDAPHNKYFEYEMEIVEVYDLRGLGICIGNNSFSELEAVTFINGDYANAWPSFSFNQARMNFEYSSTEDKYLFIVNKVSKEEFLSAIKTFHERKNAEANVHPNIAKVLKQIRQINADKENGHIPIKYTDENESMVDDLLDLTNDNNSLVAYGAEIILVEGNPFGL